MGRTHVLIGASTAFVAAELVHARPVEQVAVVGCAIATSKLPDVDRGPILRHYLRHRGPTHRFAVAWVVAVVAAIAGCAVAGLAVGLAAAAGAFTGYGMHLIADRMTISGIPGTVCPHLLPYGWRFRTGGFAERLFACVVLAGLVFYALHA